MIGRFVLRDRVRFAFVHESLNDVLCLPICVPLLIAALNALGLRDRTRSPDLGEVIAPLIVIAVVFEIWLPGMNAFEASSFADARDIVWYAAGGFIGAVWWQMRYPEVGG